MSAFAGVNGDVQLSTSPSTAIGAAVTFNDSGDHIHYFSSSYIAWDQSQGITVQCSPNGSSGWTTVTDYVYYWPVGEIVFNTARGVGTNNFVRVSQGNYFTLSSLDGAHAWKASFKGTVKDVTAFQSVGAWCQYLATLKNLTFSVDCYRQDARILQEMITGTGSTNISGGIIVCSLYWNVAGGSRWQFYGLPTGISQTVAANDVNKQSVTFQSTGPAYVILSNSFSTATVIQE